MKTLLDSCSVQMLAPQPPASAHPASVTLGRPPCAGPLPPRCAKRATPPRDEPEEILPRLVVFWMLCVLKIEVYKEVAAAVNWVFSEMQETVSRTYCLVGFKAPLEETEQTYATSAIQLLESLTA
jgi:hypothetical protein